MELASVLTMKLRYGTIFTRVAVPVCLRVAPGLLLVVFLLGFQSFVLCHLVHVMNSIKGLATLRVLATV